MAAPKNAVAVTPGGVITEDMVIGFFIFFNVPDQYKSAVTIRKHWLAAGLPEDRLPRKRQEIHVAQKALRSIEGDASNGVRRRVVVDEIGWTKSEFLWQVTLQIWDDESKLIEHEKSMRVTFDKNKGEFSSFEQLDRDAYNHLEGLEDRIRDHFEAHASRLPGHKLRTLIREMLEKEGVENVSESGKSAIYWAPIEAKEILEGITHFLQATYRGDSHHVAGNLHKIPCVDDQGQREFLKQRFVQNCEDDLQKFRDKLLTMLKQQQQGERKRGFRSDMLHNLKEERAKLIERREKFSELLEDTLGELDASSRLADSALSKLMAQAEV